MLQLVVEPTDRSVKKPGLQPKKPAAQPKAAASPPRATSFAAPRRMESLASKPRQVRPSPILARRASEGRRPRPKPNAPPLPSLARRASVGTAIETGVIRLASYQDQEPATPKKSAGPRGVPSKVGVQPKSKAAAPGSKDAAARTQNGRSENQGRHGPAIEPATPDPGPV